MKHILIIDDDPHINHMLERILTKEGYQVSHAYSGTEAILLLASLRPNLILLDLMLPGLSGEDVLPRIQNIPVIVMSAKADIENKVELLLGGAVDYLTKPFHTKELLARIAVHLRIRENVGQPSVFTFENLKLDTDTHQVSADGNEVRLTRTEYALIKLFLQNQTRVLSKSFLLNHISEDTPDCTESSLKIHISNLRRKLKEAGNRDYIEAVWGIGFKLKEQ